MLAAQPAPVVIDASVFVDELQKGHTVTDAARLDADWIFNNTALVMGSRSNYVVSVDVPEAGTYHLFARTHGRDGSAFRVAVDDVPIADDLGDAPLRFEHAGAFTLEAGPTPLRLMQIDGAPVLDVLVLTRNDGFTEADLRPLELGPDVVLLRTYAIPRSGAVKFGDLTGDGRMDLLVLTRDYSAHAFDHDGRALWVYEAPEAGRRARSSFEAPGLVWDLDGDGAAEAVHWRQTDDGREWLVAADGATGAVKLQTPWPTRPMPHAYNNFRLAAARLAPGDPRHVVAFTDMGGRISVTAYDGALRQVWQHVEEKQKDHLGHYVYPVDLDGDGLDEVLVSALLLDHEGREIWNRFDLFYDHHDHADSYRFADLDGDGHKEIVAAHSEVGAFVYDARTGATVWQHTAEHTQQVETGRFLEGVPGPQVAMGARTYGNREAGEPYLSAQVWWFTPTGELVSKWPGKPLNGNPVFVKGDWTGDGGEALFWHKFRMRPDGTGALYFAEPVFHMFDFLGDAAEEVIALGRGTLHVYGYRGADASADPTPASPDYLKRRVANHTHY